MQANYVSGFMQNRIPSIQDNISALRQEIVNHPVYNQIHTIKELKTFMQFHVYAVWDFMSLLKSLQKDLTCTDVPWFPKGSAETRFLINEIVVGEESDIDLQGNRISHFELYLQAMQQCGANTNEIKTFIEALKSGHTLTEAFEIAGTAIEARNFVQFTFEVINSEKSHLKSAIFTFGREDLIPGMFISLINDIYKAFPDSVEIFKYYLERHIEVDGDHHSHLALKMTEELCQNDEKLWDESETYIVQSLQKRIELWNGVKRKINEKVVEVG